MQSNNKVIVASAGSGKTTSIVEDSLTHPNKKILFLTYTNNNLLEIKQKFYNINNQIPPNVSIQTWFTFLLEECVRPYQNFTFGKFRIESIYFVNQRSAPYIPKNNVEKYYFFGKSIFSDKLAEFSIRCNTISDGLVIERLSSRFDKIYIDEIQDLAGYDLDFIELLLQSKISINLVGDNRQATFSTNSSAKNEKYKGFNIIELFKKWDSNRLCALTFQAISYRCDQKICDFADALFPEMPRTKSVSGKKSPHDGVFILPKPLLNEYLQRYSPFVLRYDRRTVWESGNVMNFGESKGLTFSRILILPNAPIARFLLTGDVKNVLGEREKLYVAITRAIYSVAFLYDGVVGIESLETLSSIV